jgi:hypothetical protein
MKIDLHNLASQVSEVGANSRIQLGKTANAPEIKTTNFFGRLWNAVTRTTSEKAQNQETINQVLKSIEENGGILSPETRDYMEGLATQGKPLSARRFNALMKEAALNPSGVGEVDSDDDEPLPSTLDLLKNSKLYYLKENQLGGVFQEMISKRGEQEMPDLSQQHLTWNGVHLSGSAEEKAAQLQQNLQDYAGAPERGSMMTQFLPQNTLRDLSRIMSEANITSKWDVRTNPDSNFLTIKSVPTENESGFSFDYLPSQLTQGVGTIHNSRVEI